MKRIPNTRYYRGPNSQMRYKLSFETADQYFADAVTDDGSPYPPMKGWGWHLACEIYDEVEGDWWNEEYLAGGHALTVREAERRACGAILRSEEHEDVRQQRLAIEKERLAILWALTDGLRALSGYILPPRYRPRAPKEMTCPNI